MKSISALILIFLFSQTYCREVFYENLDYFPKNDQTTFDYGSLKLTRSKNKTLIYFKGNFTVLQNLGNEKLIIMELYNENALMARSVKSFCEFIKTETIFWPNLIKHR